MNGVTIHRQMEKFRLEDPVMKAIRDGIFHAYYQDAIYTRLPGPWPYNRYNPNTVLHWLVTRLWMKKIQTLGYRKFYWYDDYVFEDLPKQ